MGRLSEVPESLPLLVVKLSEERGESPEQKLRVFRGFENIWRSWLWILLCSTDSNCNEFRGRLSLGEFAMTTLEFCPRCPLSSRACFELAKLLMLNELNTKSVRRALKSVLASLGWLVCVK
jgi:hypothetical protein